jgi:2-dehydro-3-deoxyglucarate aldolase
MNRLSKIKAIRELLKKKLPSVGSWMQIPDASLAELIGHAGYDWVAVDMEHGSISLNQLPNLFRGLEIGGTLPMVRIAQGLPKDCKSALDAGAGGVIVPMIETAEQLIMVQNACRWPPSGIRGVAFSRANLFGKNFNEYAEEAQSPLLIIMIESEKALNNLHNILKVKGIDAVLIGPYDLSASMGLTGNFSDKKFLAAIASIKNQCDKFQVPCGMHIVDPNPGELQNKINDGYLFIAYSIDAVFFNKSIERPRI